MRRRRFLLLGGLAVAAGPAWLRRAFADTSASAIQRKSGRPLLVLVVPASDEEKSARGHAFGEYLNHGSDAQLQPLAFVDVVCAPLSGSPLLAFYPPGGAPRAVVAGALPKDVDQRIAYIADRVRALVPVPEVRPPVSVSAGEVRKRLRDRAPEGSHWATDASCGFDQVEGLSDPEADEKISMDCGMGHVPEKSGRFLYFYTKTPQRRALERQEKQT